MTRATHTLILVLLVGVELFLLSQAFGMYDFCYPMHRRLIQAQYLSDEHPSEEHSRTLAEVERECAIKRAVGWGLLGINTLALARWRG